MTNNVNEVNGVLYTNSRSISEVFEKQHKNVLRDLKALSDDIGENDNIIESTFINRGREYKEFLVTKDGLTLYLFNIQGFNKEKMEYINTFNAMEEQLKTISVQSPEVFIETLKLTRHSVEKYLPNFISWKNITDVLPLLVGRITRETNNGNIKNDVLTACIKVLKDYEESLTNVAYKYIVTEQKQILIDMSMRSKNAQIAAQTNNSNVNKKDTEALAEFIIHGGKCKTSALNNYVHQDDSYIEDSKRVRTIVGEISKLTGRTREEILGSQYKMMRGFNTDYKTNGTKFESKLTYLWVTEYDEFINMENRLLNILATKQK